RCRADLSRNRRTECVRPARILWSLVWATDATDPRLLHAASHPCPTRRARGEPGGPACGTRFHMRGRPSTTDASDLRARWHGLATTRARGLIWFGRWGCADTAPRDRTPNASARRRPYDSWQGPRCHRPPQLDRDSRPSRRTWDLPAHTSRRPSHPGNAKAG